MATRARAVLGGTFDHLHLGHHALLSAAFEVPGRVAIGLTTDRYLREHPKPGARRIQPYARRRQNLAAWLRRHYPGRPWTIVPLEDRFGRSVGPGVRVLVASVETREGARAVNAERRRRGRAPLQLRLVPLVLADDLVPITSTRIRSGTIDPTGRRRSPIRVGIRADEPGTLRAARQAVREVFPRAVVSAARLSRRAPTGPVARSRRWSKEALRGNELGLAFVRERGGRVLASERSALVELFPRRLRATQGTLQPSILAMLRPLRPRRGAPPVPAKG